MFDVFYEAVGIRRAAGSLEEAQFVAWLAKRYPPTLIDQAGNLHYDRRVSSERTLFVAHTDTAHYHGGPNKYEVKDDNVHAVDGPLGADDAAGIQILCHLMDANVPGYYIFTRAEEVGGVGAKFLADYHSRLLAQFDRAIAFDRKDTWSVITHQRDRCASDKFAEALADQLNQQGLIYMPDDGGIFTDTALWVDIIPECTNLSCGYMHQHSDREVQSMSFLKSLMDAAVNVKWEELPTYRVPGMQEAELSEVNEVCYSAIVKAAEGKTSTLAAVLVDYQYLSKYPTCKLRGIAESVLFCLQGEDLTDCAVEQGMWTIANQVEQSEARAKKREEVKS